MPHKVEMLMWTWIVLVAPVHSVNLPEITDKEFADECVREHNKARSTVDPEASNMQYMTWDKDLAVGAKEWAQQCLFVESDPWKLGRYEGENLWAGTDPAHFNATSAIQEWADEWQHYDYYCWNCKKVCDHYIKMVRADTSKVGCAVQLCPNGVKETTFPNETGVIFVCRYTPAPRRYDVSFPYQADDPPCTGCRGTCVDKLCRPGREEVKSNYIEEAVYNGDLNYVPILVIRPLGFFFTFVAAYLARRFFPDVFCYE